MSARSQKRPAIQPESVGELPGGDHLAHLLWETSALAHAFAEPVMGARTPLSLQAIGTLQMIAAYPGITASALGRAGFKTQQAASQNTNRLQRLGYIERRWGAGRGVGLHITAAGEQALEHGLASEGDVERELEGLLGSELYEQLRALLGRSRAALLRAHVVPE